ncbi:testis-expressed protein 47 [Pseudochaenichthys georgianus]|uniref:testis-expressed protein 47 n=1 Tax=Pseudochaenichthys georgianus TaxID=52239 RepID=UPI00146C2C98|nr:testis-expressed protein 47-like [Pseudochaenichthys georgianus]XP_033963144.1 testis-expressed protein 47-like [Pseudochaenichthys georgianus]
MTEKSLEKITSFSWDRDSEDMEEDSATMFDVFNSHMRERIVLQRLIVIARLPHDLADRTELGAHYERLNFQLSKRYSRDLMTGRLYIYPSCLLHIIESSREVLLSVLTDLKDMQHQTHGALLEAPRVVFMAHRPQSRLFQQWSYKVLEADQVAGDPGAKAQEDEEETTETLVCTVLSGLQKLDKSKKAVPGSVWDEPPELIASQRVLYILLAREELLTPQQHLQMYNSPLDIHIDFGQVIRSSRLTTV